MSARPDLLARRVLPDLLDLPDRLVHRASAV